MMQNWYNFFINGPIITHSPSEMRALGREIGKILQAGEVIALCGNLGAGKTHLTQGIMEGIGSSDPTASPTFSLVHEHSGGRIRACHFDFYRLKQESDLFGIGWDEYVDSDSVLIVEWANLFPEAMPESTSWLLLEHVGEQERKVSLAGFE